MTHVVIDDHLLRDLLADTARPALARLLPSHEPATTNLYLARLCKAVVSARGGQLTGALPSELRRALGRELLVLPDTITIVPLRSIAYRMAELGDQHPLSTLGTEAVAAAEHLGGALAVWSGDDGPGIRAAASGLGITYRALPR
jgi:hypothetical protein